MAPFMAFLPLVMNAQHTATSITWLLSSDSRNINGVVRASDGGWSVQ